MAKYIRGIKSSPDNKNFENKNLKKYQIKQMLLGRTNN
jgi:hypothetical protein